MEKKIIDQKEYLKKYLSSGDGDDKKKKKKKKMKLGAKTVKIIDDDIDLKNIRPIEENEFDIFINAEDAPQIAGVVDEHGPVDFSDKRRWKIIANDESGDLTITSVAKENKQSKQVKKISDDDLSPSKIQQKYSNDDLSPPRISKRSKDERNKKVQKDEDSDLSPPRIKSRSHINSKCESPQSNSDDDSSQEIDVPSYKIKKKTKRKEKISDDSDLSPPRKIKNYNSDINSPRKNKKYKLEKNIIHKNDSEMSSLRKKRDSNSDVSPRKNKNDSDSDMSLPRKNRKDSDSDLSPPRKSKKHKHRTKDNFEFNTSKRKYESNENIYMNDKNKNRNYDSKWHRYRDEKIERNRMYKHSYKNFKSDKGYYDSNMSPPQKRNRDSTSPNRFRRNDRDFYKSKSNRIFKENKSKYKNIEEGDTNKQMKKTLDGKKAGLQDAKALREETEAYKKQEAEHFSKLSKEVTGVGQAVVIRDTKTGKKRNLEAEAQEERERQKQQEELDEKYAKWGKGLKQVEDHEEKLKDDLYEMSKPLARYADDADLDKILREQEREGDPMLEYIKQKQIKEGKRKPDPPKYEGSFMPNRFGIKPGHRWDGVDRSNGYEKRWFEAQNAKVARQEEAYKWSTSDM
ncbi:BUD13 [Apis mellifera caucasica]|uniref:BUD13 homolog n=1 Tax=Apis mellifera TaxID=7460 RepID=A0A7M7R4S3_APIME|nr:BUD13 homolog [Apis mellifera]KAG6804297.1 BUD13 [Apis mellifera caucasica]|eukprot:XP_392248.5 BUD13 homolog [Apis mellifera]